MTRPSPLAPRALPTRRDDPVGMEELFHAWRQLQLAYLCQRYPGDLGGVTASGSPGGVSYSYGEVQHDVMALNRNDL